MNQSAERNRSVDLAASAFSSISSINANMWLVSEEMDKIKEKAQHERNPAQLKGGHLRGSEGVPGQGAGPNIINLISMLIMLTKTSQSRLKHRKHFLTM